MCFFCLFLYRQEYHAVLSPLLVFLNTFATFFIVLLAVPLVVLLCGNMRTSRLLLQRILLGMCGTLATKAFFTMLFVYFLRRHLMVCVYIPYQNHTPKTYIITHKD